MDSIAVSIILLIYWTLSRPAFIVLYIRLKKLSIGSLAYMNGSTEPYNGHVWSMAYVQTMYTYGLHEASRSFLLLIIYTDYIIHE